MRTISCFGVEGHFFNRPNRHIVRIFFFFGPNATCDLPGDYHTFTMVYNRLWIITAGDRERSLQRVVDRFLSKAVSPFFVLKFQFFPRLKQTLPSQTYCIFYDAFIL